jgi:hypothetical protein
LLVQAVAAGVGVAAEPSSLAGTWRGQSACATDARHATMRTGNRMERTLTLVDKTVRKMTLKKDE